MAKRCRQSVAPPSGRKIQRRVTQRSEAWPRLERKRHYGSRRKIPKTWLATRIFRLRSRMLWPGGPAKKRPRRWAGPLER